MKKILPISILALLLTLSSGCNNPATSSSSQSSESSLDLSTYTLNIDDMKDLLVDYSFILEGENTESATRTTKIIEQQMYAIMTEIITEELTAYESPFAIIRGSENISYKSTDTILGDDYEGFAPKSDTFISFRGVYDNTYHEVIDYGKGKERDTAKKYTIGLDIHENELDFQASMQASYFVFYYLENVFEVNYGKNYVLTPTTEDDGTLTYFVDYSASTEDAYGEIYFNVSLSFNMTLDGFINNFNYQYKETAKDYTEYGELGEEYTLYEISDVCQVNKGNKKEVPETLDIIPTDYWLQSYDVEIIVTDYLDVEEKCDFDKVKCGLYIEARAINVYPEKALDTKLTIVSSSDNSVIKVEGNGIVASLKGGTTNLKITSESGIERNVSLTTFEESIKELEVKIFATHLFVGETYGVYEFYSPENAIDTLTWESSNPEVATVTVDSNNYASINCISVGEVTITATSTKDPSVSASVTVRVSEILTEEALKSLITAETWYNIETPEDQITFNSNGTGTVTFKDFFTEETGTYEFNWIYAEYDETEGLLISITTQIGDYNFSVCVLSLNGETLEVYFQMTDPEMWFFQYTGDFTQNKA